MPTSYATLYTFLKFSDDRETLVPDGTGAAGSPASGGSGERSEMAPLQLESNEAAK